MLHSLLEHNQAAGIHIDYLHGDDTSEPGRRALAAMVQQMGAEITFHQVSDSWVEGLPVHDFTLKATWYRIALDELLPDADRILYLDVDLLVRDSLVPLWNMPLQGNVIAAVTNVPPTPDRWYTERAELGGDRYFNAGVLLVDLAAMRREGIGDYLRKFARENAARLKWRDQDALNEVLHARRLALHPRWNCMNAVMQFTYVGDYFEDHEVQEARARPAIRHFEGPSANKAWHLLGDRDGWRLYEYHRSHTPWPRARREGVTPPNLVRYLSPTSRTAPLSARFRRAMNRVRTAAVRGLWLRVWAPTGGRLTARLFRSELIARTNNFDQVSWLGTPVGQNVLDLWVIQEAIAEVRPALLIETGTHHGGATLFYAGVMDLIGHGRVLTMNLVPHPELSHPRVEFIQGGSTDPGVLERVRSAARAADGPVMVILSGNHKGHHVARELELYAPLVTPGSYILSQDGVIDQVSLLAGARPGPLEANRAFLQRHPEFEHDRERTERFIVTHHPTGWLRRRDVS
jgi:cephalosporin hydroxylase/lipopolysaccharide biosynthesis glycosyltransferase